ncbi:MAG: hypothetical protein MJ072_01140, partial [Clostridia bacterium]|nr:hypothetical protein [Clostridia bacterium]
MLDYDYLYPVRVVKEGGNTSNIDALFKRRAIQIGLIEKDCYEMKGKSFVILDFGKELHGAEA